MRIALYQPDIAQNTGTILRLAACFATPVDIIGPTGFDMSDRALRRAALDYVQHTQFVRHESFAAFLAARSAAAPTGVNSRLVLLTSHAERSLYDFTFLPTDTLLLGRESAGVPDSVRDVTDHRLRIPIVPPLRSLNVAVATALALGEALRQTGGLPEHPASQD